MRIEAYARGMWRYRWRAVIVMWAISIAGWSAVYLMPPVYRADARISVDPDNALRPLLRGIAPASDVMSKVNMVTREILSRPNLAEVAQETDLHLRVNTPAQFENLLTELRRRIRVVGNRDNIFTITYQDPDRATAVAVVDALVSTFVEKSLGAERSDSDQAQSFLQAQINDYEARLTAAEDRLAQFKRDNVKVMPDQRGDYFDRLQTAEGELEATRGQLQLAEQRKLELMRQLEGEEPVFGIVQPTPSAPVSDGYKSSKIAELELELEELRLQYTDKHPRIKQILATIELLRSRQEQNRTDATISGDAASTPLELNPVYQNMRIQLSQTEVEIATLRAKLRQQREQVAELQKMVDTVPQVEAELGRLNRDYRVVKEKYEQLLAQLETANIGEDVEESIDDLQFRIIDPPFAGPQPAGPQRQTLISGILLAAIGAGGALAFLLDQLHPVFFSSRDLTAISGLPVLGPVSLIMSPQDLARKRIGRLRLAVAVVLLIAVYLATLMFSEELSPVVRSFASMET